MYCRNCGADIPDGSKFCPKCGADLSQEEDHSAQKEPENSTQIKEEELTKTTEENKEKDTSEAYAQDDLLEKHSHKISNKVIGIIIAAVIVVAAIVVLIIVFSSGKTTIDLSNYLNITTEGFDGYGTASSDINTEKLEADFKGKIKLSSEGEKNASISMAVQSGEDPVELISGGVSGSLDQDSDLSNGDKITFTWDVDPTLAEYLNVDIKHSDIKKTVEDLEALTETDVFENVSVEFSGLSPQGEASVSVNNNEDGITSSMFSLDKSTWLSNGDTITVTISENSIEKLGRDSGLVPNQTTKEYTVEGLSRLASDLNEIPEDTLNTAWTRIEETYSKELEEWTTLESNFYIFSDRAGPTRQLISMSHLGNYFLRNEETGNNKLIFIYQMDVVQNRGEAGHGMTGGNYLDDPLQYYWFACYSDIEISPEGNCVIPSEYEDPNDLLGDKATFETTYSYSWAGVYSGTLTYTGFQYLDEMTQEIEQDFPEYTLIDDTVTKENESELDEDTVENEPAPEENDGT